MVNSTEPGDEMEVGDGPNNATEDIVYENGFPVYPPIVIPPPPERVSAVDQTGPRLVVTHITNENFKSYAGIQILGPFHKSLSCIVGPNGSGKSNVIDSMLFVFGYRANKIRSKKISVLIHNSEKHQNLNSCTVGVHFQKIIDTGTGENDFTVVPSSQFVVSRTAFRDNSSYYKINDRKVQYKEVATLLRGNGIDLDHNRFLILQGEVEQIATMKPKALTEHEDGMLEFLEDIVGSSRFKSPIELLAKRVEHVTELRAEKLNRAKIVEKEKNELEGPKNEAVEYLCRENEMAVKRNMLFQKYILDCTENEQKAVSKHDEIQQSRQGMLDRLEVLANEKRVHLDEHKAVTKKYEVLAKECEDLKAEFSQFEQRDVRCREDLKMARVKAKKLEKQLEQEKKKLEDLQAAPAKAQSEIEELNKRLDKLQADKVKEEDKLKTVMDSLKTETKGLQEEKDTKEKELLDLQKFVNETKSKYQLAQSELDLCLSNHQHERAKLQEIQANLTKVSGQLKDARSAVQELSKMIPKTEASLHKDRAELDTVTATEAKLNEQVRRARMRTEEARSSFQANKSRGKVFDAILNLKKTGKVAGIYGRLGDLGAIEEKYDVAISTACGALDNIVVDTIATAQTCVEYLKKNDIGIATFIGLDKMAKWRDACRQTIETPEKAPRLFDLVRVQDEAVLPAFYYALQNTLVANDLEQATRIAYGRSRFRVVTLGGELIEQSGTMSGGGKQACKGRIGKALVVDLNPEEIIDLEKQLEQNMKELQVCRDRRVTLEESTERQQKELDVMKHTLEKHRVLIAALEKQEPVLSEQVKVQEKKTKDAEPDDKEVKKLEKTVAATKKEFESSQANASTVEEQVQKLHKQIMDIGGSKLKTAQQRLDTVNGQIDLVTGEVTKLGVSIKTAQRNATKTEEKIQTTEEEMTANNESIVALNAEFKQLEVDAAKVEQKKQKAQETRMEYEMVLAKLKEKLAAVEHEEQSVQKDDVEVKHELEKYATIMKENQSKIKLWKKEVSKLKLHEVDSQQQQPTQLQTFDADALRDVDTEKIQYEITIIEEQLNRMKPNMAAILEYKRKEEQYLKRVEELDRITELRDQQRQLHDDYRKMRLGEFMEGFGIITHKLKEMYRMITLGGDAELELVDSLDPFSEGIVFSVRPPKKSWKNISNLSGGEKTLSSLALVFALHHYKPTPLYVMDEIDAALDFKNVSIVANYVKDRTKNAQFIIISLRSNMFELADRLIGIYKTHDCTKSVVINPNNICLSAVAPPADGPTLQPDTRVRSDDNGELARDLVS